MGIGYLLRVSNALKSRGNYVTAFFAKNLPGFAEEIWKRGPESNRLVTALHSSCVLISPPRHVGNLI